MECVWKLFSAARIAPASYCYWVLSSWFGECDNSIFDPESWGIWYEGLVSSRLKSGHGIFIASSIKSKFLEFDFQKSWIQWRVYPAPAGAGAAPPKNQGNCEARSAIYATAAVPIFEHVFFALPREVPISNCFNGLLRALTKNSLEDRMSKFHLVKKWWDFENRDFGV